MTIATSTLRPGLLVSLKTSTRGNVRYDKVDLDAETGEDGAAKARWETTRTIADPVEYDRACKTRSKAAALIRRVCTNSAFGLLCPHENSDQLEAAIKEARELTEAFNSEAALTRIHVYVIAGQVAADDVEAVKAINSEVRELLEAMAEGVRNTDVKVIREAASKAKELGAMLSPDAEARVRIAIDTARSAARQIVKAGEQAALEIDKAAIRKITEQRTAFLDLSEGEAPAAPKAEARALDLAPDEDKGVHYASGLRPTQE